MRRLVDRSRMLKFQRCPRGRYLGYEHQGRGVVPVRLSIPLATGQYVHQGLAHLLQHPDDVEGAVKVAVGGYDDATAARGLATRSNEVVDAVYREQRALIEALIRAYAACRLKPLLQKFRVLEVEQEDLLPMGLVRVAGEKVPLVWMSRADALLQERTTGDVYLESFKTAASWDRRRSAEGDHDVQGLSEVAAIEGRFAAWAYALGGGMRHDVPAWFREAYAEHGGIAPPVMGVRMEYLLKGERREDKWNPGNWVQWSPLIRGWRRADPTPGSTGWEYAWRYEWKEEDPLTGEMRGRRLGRDWERFEAWNCVEIGYVKGWIEMLDRGQVQPEAGDCLDEQFAVPVPYFRQQDEIEDWFEQAVAQESRVAVMSAVVQEAPPEERRSLLNRYFPQHRRCDWPAACPFQEICFGSEQVAADPVGSGLYVWREPHHEAEVEQLRLAA